MKKRIFTAVFAVALFMLALTASVVTAVLWRGATAWAWWALVLIALALVAVAAGVSLGLSVRLSKRIARPLNALDLDNPPVGGDYEELSPLLRRISGQRQRLRLQESALERQKNEFESATRNMTEGLVVLNEKGEILSINNSASRLLGTTRYCVGKKLTQVNGSAEMRELLRRAQSGEHAEMTIPLGGGDYQINASPVMIDETVSGFTLIIFDITEKEKAEQMRREFTANVSHELKTPLQNISGCAELLCSGMVKAEDVPKFSQQIFSESKRMIALVEDIIDLSHLDEGAVDLQREEVDLYDLAAITVENLTSIAKAADVTMTLTGTHAVLRGIPQLLSVIIFNLCDNAIKYNVKGGRVAVDVFNGQECVRLTVTDTGIGIPAEQCDRIFERFYRVDKSHSKEVGGTGLGLSIVKHAAKLHSADVQVNSILGQGTRVTVLFPK